MRLFVKRHTKYNTKHSHSLLIRLGKGNLEGVQALNRKWNDFLSEKMLCYFKCDSFADCLHSQYDN